MFGHSPIGQVNEAVAQAAAVDRSTWSGSARSAAVLELMAAKERLDALILGVVGEWDRDQGWALDGAISPVAWLAHRLPLTRQDAVRVGAVRASRRDNEKTAKALDAGDITATHVELTARAVRHREDLYPEHEDVILDAARSLPPAGFRKAMEHWRNCADAVLDHKDSDRRARTQLSRHHRHVRRHRAPRWASRHGQRGNPEAGARHDGAARFR